MQQGVTHPAAKKFPKLRGGTLDSTLKFMLKLLHLVCNNGTTPTTEAADSITSPSR